MHGTVVGTLIVDLAGDPVEVKKAIANLEAGGIVVEKTDGFN